MNAHRYKSANRACAFAGVLLAVLVLFAVPAHAWGPATHAYLVTRILGEEIHDAVFGSTLSDFNGAARLRPELDSAIKHLTHYEFERMRPCMFAAGFSTHNGAWGADHYAHSYLEDIQGGHYATRQIKKLSERTRLSLHMSEDVFEAAMDIRIAVDCGPWLGHLLRESARRSGRENEEALVEAYAGALAARVQGLALADAESALRWAYRAHKVLMGAYGIQLVQDRAYMLRLATPLLARYLHCDTATARRHLDIAIELCADWRTEMDQIATEVRDALRKSPYGACAFSSRPSGSSGDPD